MKDNQEKIEKKLDQEKITLSSFVENNNTLINSLGVFTALIIFASSLPLKSIGLALSFLFLIIVLLLWFELWERFPAGSTTWRLIVFENILSLTVLILVVHWLLDYRGIWSKYLFILIFALILTPISYTLKKYDVFNVLFDTKPGRSKVIRYALGVIVIGSVFIVSTILAKLLANPFNRFLDNVHKLLQISSQSN